MNPTENREKKTIQNPSEMAQPKLIPVRNKFKFYCKYQFDRVKLMSINPTKLQPQSAGNTRPVVFPLKEKNDNAGSRYLYLEHLLHQSSGQKSSIDSKLPASAEKYFDENPEFTAAVSNHLKAAQQPQHFFFNLNEIPGSNFPQSQSKSKSNLSTTPSRESENLRHDSSYELTSKPNFSPYTPNKIILQPKAKNQRISQSPSDKRLQGNSSAKKKSLVHEVDYFHTMGDDPIPREKATPTKSFGRQLTPQKLRTPNSDPQNSKLFSSVLPKTANRLLFSKRTNETSPSNRQVITSAYSPMRSLSQSQLPVDVGISDAKLDTSKGNGSSSIIPFVKERIKYVTQCKEHNNQQLVFFNSLTKQLACVDCVYCEIGVGGKKSTYLPLQNAVNEISELNKAFKSEAQEKIYDIENQLHVYKANYSKIQENLNYMLESISSEFQDLYEELRIREAKLTEAIYEAASKQQGYIKGQIENLEFLKSCYRDAKEVNPNSSTEQCVHFYAVFNLLKNTNKSLDFPEHITPETLDRIEFRTEKEIKELIANFGKLKTYKKRALGDVLKRNRMSAGSIASQKGADRTNRSFEVNTPSPVREVERRATTPNRRASGHLSPPPTSSYLEREGFRNKMKAKETQNKQPDHKSQPHYMKPKNTSPSPQRQAAKRSAKASGSLKPHNTSNRVENSKKESNGSIKLTKSSTEYTSPAKMESTTGDLKLQAGEFGSPGKDSSYFKFQSVDEQGMIRFHESLDQIAPADLTKGSEMYFEAVSFNGENSFGLFMDSKILTDPELRSDLALVLNTQIQEAKLLYRLSSDGASSETFHTKCDNEAPVLAIVHANQNYIFGYYMPVPFAKAEKYTQCEESFIFSLRNPEFKGSRVFPIRSDKKFIAFYQSNRSPCLGSTIVNKQDLLLE